MTRLSKGKEKMTTNRKRQFFSLAVLAGISGMLIAAAPQTVLAGGDQDIVGAWAIQVTLRNCETSAPMGSFVSLVTFHRGGTLSETTGSVAFQPGQRTDGHGAWTRIAPGTFTQNMLALIRFDSPPNLPATPTFDPSKPVSPGFTAGGATISHVVRLTGEDTLESSGTNEFFASDGTPYRSGCSTATGQRFD
jgi:hypothetical protein